MKWNFNNIPNLNHKIIIVTGGNSGVGYETARMSAAKGGNVIIGCRNLKKGWSAVEKIKIKHPNARIEVLKLNLASLESIKNFTDEFKDKYNQLHYLFNNAGVMALPYSKTEDGFEIQLGTNHFGHFALTGLLFDILKVTKGSRIVNVSSNAHRQGTINFEDINLENSFSKFNAYNRSKIANLLFTYELHRKLIENDLDIASLAAHPGISYTNLAFQEDGIIKSRFLKFLGKILMPILFQSPKKGALPQLYAAYSDDAKGSDYIGPRGLGEMGGYPKKVESVEYSHNKEVAAKLWEISEDLTGIKFNFSDK